jgi:hypothetical protein
MHFYSGPPKQFLSGVDTRRQRWQGWAKWHITGMGLSYILLLTAFYVDNGKSLPLWRDLPTIAYWLLPAAVGVPLLLHALLRHPLARAPATLPALRRLSNR